MDDILTDKFPYLVSDFLAYENKQDITSTLPGILQAGSQNMFIVKLAGSERPSKLVTRAGMTLLGQASTLNIGIRSEFDKFYDRLGDILLMREYPKGGAEGDIIEVLVQNEWYRLTLSLTDLPTGTHAYRFSEWWDVKNNQSRLVMVNGNYDTVTNISKVLSWTGGYAQVVGVGTNTLSLSPLDTWEAHGFIQNSPNFLVFQGQQFIISSGWATDTLTLTTDPTNIIVPGDYVFQGIRSDSLVGQSGATITGFTLDTISNYINHIVYGDFKNAKVYFSQIEDQDAETSPIITGFNLGVNDLNFFKGNPYTATDNNTYKIQVTSSTYVNTESYNLTNILNDITWQPTGYTGGSTVHGHVVILDVAGTPDQVKWYLDGVLDGGQNIIAGSPIFFSDGVSFVFSADTGHSTGDTWTLNYGGVDTVTTYKNDTVVSNVAITGATQSISDGIIFQFATIRGHNIGDNWSINAFPAVTDAWKNTSFSQPSRLPGEGTFLILDAPIIDMLPQEDGIYFNTRSGSWIKSTFTISSDLTSESITTTKLKSQYQNKMLANGLVNYDLNSIIYITQDKTVLSLGRLEFLQEPQNQNISDPVKYDFLFANFADGDVKLWGTYQVFTAPHEGMMFIYDLALKIWQPPQVFTDPIGKMSVREGRLIGHSFTRNMSYTLFSGTNDNGSAFTTRVVLPYNNYKWGRDQNKMYSMTWCEGYISGAPQIEFTVNRGLLGCQGYEMHAIMPKLCVPPSEAPLGAGNLGSHALGSDNIQPSPKFREVWKTQNSLPFYEANMVLECSTIDQDWQLVSIGINVVDSPTNNDEIVSNVPFPY